MAELSPLERRRQAAEQDKAPIRVNPWEPPEVKAWVRGQTEPIDEKHKAIALEHGPRPQRPPGIRTASPGFKAAVAEWRRQWGRNRVQHWLEHAEALRFPPAALMALENGEHHLRAHHGAAAAEHMRCAAAQVQIELDADRLKAEADTAETAKARGQSIARTNVALGYSKLAEAIAEEETRHAGAVKKLDAMPRRTPLQKLAREHAAKIEEAHHAHRWTRLSQKLEGLKALEVILQ